MAKKYFDRNHCTLVRSKMGFPSHDAAVKPDWEHLEAQNKEAHPDFAMMIAANQPDPIRPQVIDINSEVAVMPLGDHFKLYSAPNPATMSSTLISPTTPAPSTMPTWTAPPST